MTGDTRVIQQASTPLSTADPERNRERAARGVPSVCTATGFRPTDECLGESEMKGHPASIRAR